MNPDDARMRQIITEMTVISEAAAQRFGEIVHGGECSNQPKGPRTSMAEYHARAWRRAHSPQQRSEALEAAEKGLVQARFAPRRTNTPGTLEWRLAIADDPRPAKTVAQVFGVSLAHVYNMRKISGTTRKRAA